MAATVRSPGARIAPIMSTLAHSHTRSLKTASKWRNTCIIPFGRVSIFSFSFARILREAYSVFPFLSSDWIKSTLLYPILLSLSGEGPDRFPPKEWSPRALVLFREHKQQATDQSEILEKMRQVILTRRTCIFFPEGMPDNRRRDHAAQQHGCRSLRRDVHAQ